LVSVPGLGGGVHTAATAAPRSPCSDDPVKMDRIDHVVATLVKALALHRK
jgi:hypothetical protein